MFNNSPTAAFKIDCMKFSVYPCCINVFVGLRKPLVPGFWPGNDLVGFISIVNICDIYKWLTKKKGKYQ
ncbi:unnamed protein product [Schistosoma mattheei]|uniref:Uncharacterized protein n=1 Tax=Schistosoma mattheei TaxID=31246 RepID=A0A3P8G6D4_9TREM|nr:unnamed protein product [Schistosoma mattheei]